MEPEGLRERWRVLLAWVFQSGSAFEATPRILPRARFRHPIEQPCMIIRSSWYETKTVLRENGILPARNIEY